MALKVDHHWPLTIIKPIQKNTLQKELVSNFSPQNKKQPLIIENLSDREGGTVWEKGTFVDVYI